jgi:hypothetical protein
VCRVRVNLPTEQAYYDRLCDKLEGAEVGLARRRKGSPDD